MQRTGRFRPRCGRGWGTGCHLRRALVGGLAAHGAHSMACARPGGAGSHRPATPGVCPPQAEGQCRAQGAPAAGARPAARLRRRLSRRKAKHAEFLTDMLERLLADLPEPPRGGWSTTAATCPERDARRGGGRGAAGLHRERLFRGHIQDRPAGDQYRRTIAGAGPWFYLSVSSPTTGPSTWCSTPGTRGTGSRLRWGLPAGYVFVP